MQLPRADYTSSGTDEEGTTRCGWADAAKHAAGTPATQRRPAPRLAPPNDVPRLSSPAPLSSSGNLVRRSRRR